LLGKRRGNSAERENTKTGAPRLGGILGHQRRAKIAAAKGEAMVLVTGGTGLLGRGLVAHLVERGERVRVLHRGAPSGPGEPVRGDVTDPASLEAAVRGVAIVYHLAAQVDHAAPAAELDRVNVGGTVNVTEAAARAGVGRLVHCSTVSAEPGGGTTEYGRSKIRAEQALMGYAGRLATVVVRPGPIYCEDRPTLRRAVRWARRTRLWGVLVPDLTVHVASRRNAVEALALAAERGAPGAAYVACDARPVARSVLSRIVAEKTGAVALPLPVPLLSPLLALAALAAEGFAGLTGGRPRLTRRYLRVLTRERRYDTSRAERELGYRPNPTQVDFAETVDRCLAPRTLRPGGAGRARAARRRPTPPGGR
jgi:nucleoside-diphosphate-sugar epimerase